MALDGKTVVNVGAGFSFGKENNFLLGLSAASPKVNYVPVDIRFDMAKSWHLFDSNNPETYDEVELNPVVADGRQLPFVDESVDGYASINLVNIPTKDYSAELFVKELLVEAARVLKKGGFILVNSFGYMYHNKDGVLVKINNDIQQENIISLQKLKSILYEAGFTEVEPLLVDEGAVARVEQEDQKLLRRSDSNILVSCHEYGGFLAFKRS